MKQKKQKEMIALLAILTVVLCGWWLMKWDGLWAKDQNMNPKGSTEVSPLAGETWLPGYSLWKDSLTNYIPKENAFVMMWMEESADKPITAWDKEKSSSGWEELSNNGFIGMTPGAQKVDQWLWFDKVGYYDGSFVDVKVTIKCLNPSETNDGDIRFYSGKERFLSVWLQPSSNAQVSISYELYKQDGKVVHVGSYQSFEQLDANKTVDLKKGIFGNLYSVSTSYKTSEGTDAPILLQYKDSVFPNYLQIFNSDKHTSVNEQDSFTATYSDLSAAGYYYALSQIGKNSGSPFAIIFSPNTISKVEFPNPQGGEYIFSEIIGEKEGILGTKGNATIEPFSYQFMQQVPFETSAPKNNRTQTPTWKVSADKIESDTLVGSLTNPDWLVESRDNLSINDQIKSENWFTYTPDGGANLGDGILKPSTSILERFNFYNHYYVFKKEIEIDPNKKVKKDDLDGTYNLSVSGKVTLNIADSDPTGNMPLGNRPEQKYNSKINFKASIKYEYYTEDGEEIPYSVLKNAGALEKGEGIVTWLAPLSPKKLSDNDYDENFNQGEPVDLGEHYKYVGAEFNGKKVTTNSDLRINVTKRLVDGVEESEATPQDYSEDNVVRLIYKVDNWLPDYKPNLGLGHGGWLNSVTNYIPKENSFFMMYMGEDKTKINEEKSSSGWEVYDWSKQYAVQPVWYNDGLLQMPNVEGAQKLWFDNVGFINGAPVNIEVSLTMTNFDELDPTQPNVALYTTNEEIEKGGRFLTPLILKDSSAKVKIETRFYQTIDNKDQTIDIGSYQTFDQLDLNKYLQIPVGSIQNIYSIDRQYTVDGENKPIALQYELVDNDSQLQVSSPWRYFGNQLPRNGFTVTYKSQANSSYLFSKSVSGNLDGNAYGSMYSAYFNIVKVEIPDPQGIENTYTEIISDGKKGIMKNGTTDKIDAFGYQFVQNIPFESYLLKDNRTQFPTWEVNENPLSNALKTSTTHPNWSITSEDDETLNGAQGAIQTEEWFHYESDPQNSLKGKFSPKGSVDEGTNEIDSELITSEDSEFYNHYYSFQKELEIDYQNPIEPNDLKNEGKPLGLYSLSGTVDLSVYDTNPITGMYSSAEQAEYQTAINFLADDVQYKYLDKTIYDAQITAEKTESEARAAAAINFSGLTWGTTSQPSGTGQAIVTWQVPLTPTTYTDETLADPGTPESATNKAPTIPGYEYVTGSAELNAQTADYQVKVTKFLADGKTEAEATAADYTKPNEVVLFYEPQGDVEIEDEDEAGVTTYLADDIDFGNITVPTASTITKAPEANNGTDKDQYPSLVVKDTRLKNYRNSGWTLYVEMTKPFRLKKGDGTFDENETIDNILKYKNNFNFIKDGTATVPTELAITKGDKIPIESLIPTATQLNETIWRTQVDLGAQKEENGEASKGFYLEINKATQLGIKAGEYQAELTFSVENSAFTTSPGRSK